MSVTPWNENSGSLYINICVFMSAPSHFLIKHLDYSKPFRSDSSCANNYSQEGPMRLKLASFCSPRQALSDGILVCQNRIHHFLAKNQGLHALAALTELKSNFPLTTSLPTTGMGGGRTGAALSGWSLWGCGTGLPPAPPPVNLGACES